MKIVLEKNEAGRWDIRVRGGVPIDDRDQHLDLIRRLGVVLEWIDAGCPKGELGSG